ncbi:MAG TPA: Clp protease N-terminal domain-containing protein, partial [Saprospiraceae bacterium]|nr:Clp protease N-terminal domain-containing protein [Saprospiraceae bacterium]
MNRMFSPQVKEVLSRSRIEAKKLGQDYIGTEHLLLGVILIDDSVSNQILVSLDVDLEDLRDTIQNAVQYKANTKVAKQIGDMPLNRQAEKVLKVCFLEAKNMKQEEICPEHLVLSILKHKDNMACKILEQYDIDYDIFKSELEFAQQEKDYMSDEILGSTSSDPDDPFESEDSSGRYTSGRKVGNKSRTPVLDNFGRDVTKLAQEDKLDPIIGRQNEIERVSQILSRRKKNNPILIGEPGVGKTAIVEGLALRIIQRKVSRNLFDKRIVMLDLAALVAGTKYRGQFEERMKAIMN